MLAGVIEGAAPPADARQVWDGVAWSPAPPADPRPLDAEELFDMLEAKGFLDASDRPRPKPAGA